MPNALPIHVGVGNRDIDLLHNWEAAYYRYPYIKNITSFQQSRIIEYIEFTCWGGALTIVPRGGRIPKFGPAN